MNACCQSRGVAGCRECFVAYPVWPCPPPSRITVSNPDTRIREHREMKRVQIWAKAPELRSTSCESQARLFMADADEAGRRQIGAGRVADRHGLRSSWRRAHGHAHRSAGALDRRPSRHRSRASRQRRCAQSDRAADRHDDGRRQSLPRHARRVAEFETNLRKERQLEGIAKAKKAGASTRAGRRRSRLPRSPHCRLRASALPRLPSGSAWVERASIDTFPAPGAG